MPLCMLVAAVQLRLGLFSKAFREADSMPLSLVLLVVRMVRLARPGLDAGARHLRSERVLG
jgi:hypothetical protein